MPSVTIQAPVDKVWATLTRPDMRKQWFFGVDTKTDWKVGGPIVHTGEWQGKPYADKGRVVAFEPCHKIEHTHWSEMSGRPDKPENYETVTITVAEHGPRTEVEIHETNVASDGQAAQSEQLWGEALKSLKRVAEC